MSDQVEATVVETRHKDHPSVATLRLNRPKVKNAMGPRDISVLRDTFLRLQVDPDTRMILLTGTGDAFCSGADIKELNDLSGDAMSSFIEAQVDLLSHIVQSPKIIIAAVNGVSAGLGNHIITCCDLAVIRDDVTLHFTGAAKAIPSLLMGTLLMPMTIGLKRAKSLYLRGGKLSAKKAVEDGLCNYAVSKEDWTAEIDKLSEEFAGRSSATMAHNKFQLNQAAFQLIGSLKLSGLAGAMAMAQRSDVPVGRLR